MDIKVRNRTGEFNSYRAKRVKSLCNAESGSEFNLDASLDIDDEEWQIGLVVGPSGTGKTSIGKALFEEAGITDLYDGWSEDRPIVDDIAPSGDFNAVTGALASVGLGDTYQAIMKNNMNLLVIREEFYRNTTIGTGKLKKGTSLNKLFINGEFFCHTLEDAIRGEGIKIPAFTGIPAGEYEVKLSNSSRFQRLMPMVYTESNEQYKDKYIKRPNKKRRY